MLVDAEKGLVKRLRKHPFFWLNGSRWMMGTEPEPLCLEAADKIESLSAQVAELKTNARRYEYWRDCGICIGDAPVSFVFLEELDKFTDQAIKESGSG